MPGTTVTEGVPPVTYERSSGRSARRRRRASVVEAADDGASMRSAVGNLVARSRAGMRPRWSQQFLSDELTRRGFPVTRSQIARLETGVPNSRSMELVAAIAIVMPLPVSSVTDAIVHDFLAAHERVNERIRSAEREAPRAT